MHQISVCSASLITMMQLCSLNSNNTQPALTVTGVRLGKRPYLFYAITNITRGHRSLSFQMLIYLPAAIVLLPAHAAVILDCVTGE